MAGTDLSLSSLGSKFVDLRGGLPGDAYNWSWVRDLSQVNYLAIHHSGGSDTQTPKEIADYHINTNGWGGIGYHFLIDKDGVVYYVGDIQTARANVANLNEQVIGICLIGSFMEGREPTIAQLDSAHKLCDFLIQLPDLANIKTWDVVKGHKELPAQETDCPGDSWLAFGPKIISGPPLTGGQVVFSDPQKQIKDLQMSLGYINSQLISCQEALQEAEVKLNHAPKSQTPSIYVVMRPYLPLLLFIAWTGLVFIYNVNLLNIFFGIKTKAPFFDLVFSSLAVAWIFAFLYSKGLPARPYIKRS